MHGDLAFATLGVVPGKSDIREQRIGQIGRQRVEPFMTAMTHDILRTFPLGATCTWIVLLLTHAACAEAPTDAPRDTSAADIEQAVRDLGDDDFGVRQHATHSLWQAGESAEPALREALQSTDPEVAALARWILDRLRFGLLPDTPPQLVGLIEQFRNGNEQVRHKVIKRLTESGRIDLATRLIRSEPDIESREQLTSWMVGEIGKRHANESGMGTSALLANCSKSPRKAIRVVGILPRICSCKASWRRRSRDGGNGCSNGPTKARPACSVTCCERTATCPNSELHTGDAGRVGGVADQDPDAVPVRQRAAGLSDHGVRDRSGHGIARELGIMGVMWTEMAAWSLSPPGESDRRTAPSS